FSLSEALQIEDMLKDFTSSWKTHGDKVKGYADLLFGQFVVIMADESDYGVSGCSTDSSVRVMKEIDSRFNVNMFDRQLLAFVVKNKVELLPMSQFSYAVTQEFIDGETLYFNNLVQTKEELEDKWIIPVKESWLGSKFRFAAREQK
ncbi:MAG: hypothetical protein ABI151_11550, partial [Chitinophagaceae bacterium]